MFLMASDGRKMKTKNIEVDSMSQFAQDKLQTSSKEERDKNIQIR